MKLTDEIRSMIATEFVRGFQRGNRGLCCDPDGMNICARIVGRRKAKALQNFFYESLACGGFKDDEFHQSQEQYNLDKIADLEEL